METNFDKPLEQTIANLPQIGKVDVQIPNDTSAHDFDLPTGFTDAVLIGARCYSKYGSWIDQSYGVFDYFGTVTYIGNGKFRYTPKTAGNSTRIIFSFLKIG